MRNLADAVTRIDELRYDVRHAAQRCNVATGTP